jgi:hypothetical protein
MQDEERQATDNRALELARLLERVVPGAQEGWRRTPEAVEAGPFFARLEFISADGTRVAVDLKQAHEGQPR